MTLPDRVRAFAGRHRLWSPATRVAAAVSGGSDSTALAHLLYDLADAGHLRLAGLAHLHHGIRGPAADDDAAFVEALADALGVPCCRSAVDVPARACTAGQSVELAGRQARLSFYSEALDRLQADVIALAHTRTDQAETVLLRLVRGAGPRGLAGMAPRSGARIRPLLAVSRGELRSWLAGRGLSWREDESNADLAFARNRVRHQVLPALASINARAEEALARAAAIAGADAGLLDDLAAVALDRHVVVEAGRATLDMTAVRGLPEALASRVVLGALRAVDDRRAYGWEAVDAVMAGAPGRRWIGRVSMERSGSSVVLTSRGEHVSGRRPAAWPMPLAVPGRVDHPDGWWTVAAEGPMPVSAAPPFGADRAVLDAAALGGGLTVRSWRPGDRVQPLGLGGRKKVQDVFVDRKVPRGERDLVPVVVDAAQRIAWVGGLVVGEPFRVTARTFDVVVLTLRR